MSTIESKVSVLDRTEIPVQGNKGWQCLWCDSIIDAKKEIIEVCPNCQRERASNWQCFKCRNKNKSSARSCSSCHLKRIVTCHACTLQYENAAKCPLCDSDRDGLSMLSSSPLEDSASQSSPLEDSASQSSPLEDSASQSSPLEKKDKVAHIIVDTEQKVTPWKCIRCMNANTEHERCGKCGLDRFVICTKCSMHYENSEACPFCATPSPHFSASKPSDAYLADMKWICKCGTWNSADLSACARCHQTIVSDKPLFGKSVWQTN